MDKLHPIGQVTKAAGRDGELRMRPLSRYFHSYVEEKPLFVGSSELLTKEFKFKQKVGLGRKIRYSFEGVNTWDDAESLIGQFVFVSVEDDDKINWISPELIGFSVVTNSRQFVGNLMEILWLPTNDVYVIRNKDKEVLIPVVSEVITSISWENEQIVIIPMDGLLT